MSEQWSPPLTLEQAQSIYQLDSQDIFNLAVAGWARVDGNRLRFAARDRQQVAALRASAAAAARVRTDLVADGPLDEARQMNDVLGFLLAHGLPPLK